MSGLEVAGVVLGALPLVLSELEHYANGVASFKRYRRYRIHLQSMIDAVKTQKVIFEDTLEQLVTGIVRIEEMANFIADPGSRSVMIEPSLKKRLAGSYDVYFANVDGMCTALAVIMNKLALGADGKPQFTDLGTFKEEYRRLKFSLSKSAYDEQLCDLRLYNENLSQLTGKSLALESTRRSRATPDFKAFHDHSKTIYDALRSGLRCSCQGHAVRLRLERGKHPFFRGDLSTYSPVRVVFTKNVMEQHWAEADIRVLEDSLPEPAVESGKSLPIGPEPALEVKKRVRFGSFALHLTRMPAPSKAAKQPVPGTKLAAMASNNTQNIQKIQDLCAAIARVPSQSSECVGYIAASSQYKYGLYLNMQPSSRQNWRTLTLEEVMTRMSARKLSLSWRDKLKVAVELTSGVLQLCKTPWLKENWRKSDVVFLRRSGAPLSAMFEHPFIFSNLRSGIAQRKERVDQRTCRVIRNTTLYILGLVLIELCYGQPMIKLQTAEDLQCEGTPGVTWCTANRLIERKTIEHQGGWRHADAVRRCIWCDFGIADADLENGRFLQAVYEGVLENLEVSLQHIEG